MERGRVITRQAPGQRRFVREREAALSALVEKRPMLGERLEVEVRPDIAILWQQDVPLAARLGASMLVRHGGDARSRRAIEEIASSEGLVLQSMGEQRLWKLLGVPD
jgi:hypothetical protein